MTLKLQDMLQYEAVFDVSFFNFENSITAAYFCRPRPKYSAGE